MHGVDIMAWKKEPLAERLMRSLRLLHIHGVIGDGEFRKAAERLLRRSRAKKPTT
jgi:hypothetical protein